MGLQVGAQIRLVGKVARAVCARKRLFAGVSAHVSLQQPRPGEGLAALGTLARQGVRLDVHFKRGLGSVRLVAELAGELLLDLVGCVQLLVLQVAGLCGEALPALVTCEIVLPILGHTWHSSCSGGRLEYGVLVELSTINRSTARMRKERIVDRLGLGRGRCHCRRRG